MYQTINGLSTNKCIDILLQNKFTIINGSSFVTITDNINKFSQTIDKENIINCLKAENNIIFIKYSEITEKIYTKEELKDISIISQLDLANNIISTLIYLEAFKTLIVKFNRANKVLKDYSNKHLTSNFN